MQPVMCSKFGTDDGLKSQSISGFCCPSYITRYMIPEIHSAFELQLNHAYYKRKWSDSPNHERFRRPFNDDRFGLRIAVSDRSRPYWGYERPVGNYDLVTM